MVQIVNGYPCFSCNDVSKAKRNVDPKERDPAQPSGGVPTAPQADPMQADPMQAVGVNPADGVNRPLAEGPRGTLLNLSA